MNIALFYNEKELLRAVRKLRKKNILIQEVYSSHPLKEIERGFKRRSRFPFFLLLVSIMGLLAVIAGWLYLVLIHWPQQFSGELIKGIPSFLIMSIVALVLIGGLISWIIYIVRAGIYPERNESPIALQLKKNQCAIVLATPDGISDENFYRLLTYYGAYQIRQLDSEDLNATAELV